MYEVSTSLFSDLSHNEQLFHLLTHHGTAEPIVHMLSFVQHQGKVDTYSLICCEEKSEIEIYDMNCSKNSRIFQSKKPLIEEARKITTAMKSVPPGLDYKLITHSPEICIGTDNGIHFMNVFICKTLPQRNSVCMKE